MRLRSATAADLPAIRALHAANWRRDYAGILPDAALGAPLDAFMAARWSTRRLETARVLVARNDGLAGFAAWEAEHPEGPYLDNLHVAPGARGRGLGRALMAALASELEAGGKSGLWLIVLEANHATRSIYRRLGGVEEEVFGDRILGVPVPALKVRWGSLAPLLGAGQAASARPSQAAAKGRAGGP